MNELSPLTLSSTLAADYEALKNDWQEAKNLAFELQRELAGKANEFALLRQIFEKTRQDLENLQSGIGALRAERHGFANDSMRAIAFEQKLKRVTAERNGLRISLEMVRKQAEAAAEEIERQLESRDIQIRELTVKLTQAHAALAEAQRRARDPKWIG